jgi:hypothetical protein
MFIKLPFYSTYVRIRMAKNTLLRSEYVYYCKIFLYTQICSFLLPPLFYNESDRWYYPLQVDSKKKRTFDMMFLGVYLGGDFFG